MLNIKKPDYAFVEFVSLCGKTDERLSRVPKRPLMASGILLHTQKN